LLNLEEVDFIGRKPLILLDFGREKWYRGAFVAGMPMRDPVPGARPVFDNGEKGMKRYVVTMYYREVFEADSAEDAIQQAATDFEKHETFSDRFVTEEVKPYQHD
jgi:hypothetical protein